MNDRIATIYSHFLDPIEIHAAPESDSGNLVIQALRLKLHLGDLGDSG